MYKEIISELAETQTSLVAVSKTKSNEQILALYNQGQKDFGENRVQELIVKQKELPDDIKWHQIGSLQSNKVKHIAPFIDLIHTVDSLKLAEVINQEAIKNNRTIKVLLQVKISSESTKHGYDKRKLYEQLEKEQLQRLSNVEICGLMEWPVLQTMRYWSIQNLKTFTKYLKELKRITFNQTALILSLQECLAIID